MIKHALLDLYRSHSNRFMSGALALYLVMLIFASNSFLERTLIGMFNDKLLHFLIYSIIAALVYRGLVLEFFIERLLATLGIVGGMAAVDELLQLVSNHRVADFDDWLYDVLGAVFVLMCVIAYRSITQVIANVRNANGDEEPR